MDQEALNQYFEEGPIWQMIEREYWKLLEAVNTLHEKIDLMSFHVRQLLDILEINRNKEIERNSGGRVMTVRVPISRAALLRLQRRQFHEAHMRAAETSRNDDTVAVQKSKVVLPRKRALFRKSNCGHKSSGTKIGGTSTQTSAEIPSTSGTNRPPITSDEESDDTQTPQPEK